MKKMLVVLATLALLAMSSLAMAEADPWQPVEIGVNLTVEPVGEVFWGQTGPVELTVKNFGEVSEPVVKNLQVVSNVEQVSVSFSIKPGTDLNPWTVLQISAMGKTLNFRKDAGATYVQEGTNVLFTKSGSPLGSVAADPANTVPVTFAAHAWNGVAAVGTANLTLVTTVSIP